MCQANNSITSKVEELMELRKQAEDLQNLMETIIDEIKAYMGSEETMLAGSYSFHRQLPHLAVKPEFHDGVIHFHKKKPPFS